MRLSALQEEVSWAENKKLVGTEVELLIAEGEGRKDGATHRISGRARDNRLVHVAVGDLSGSALPRPGDLVRTTITYAAPFHLVADGVDGTDSTGGAGSGGITELRRMPSGDAWAARQAAKQAGPGQGAGVSLGMPAIGVPAPLAPAPACG